MPCQLARSTRCCAVTDESWRRRRPACRSSARDSAERSCCELRPRLGLFVCAAGRSVRRVRRESSRCTNSSHTSARRRSTPFQRPSHPMREPRSFGLPAVFGNWSPGCPVTPIFGRGPATSDWLLHLWRWPVFTRPRAGSGRLAAGRHTWDLLSPQLPRRCSIGSNA